MIEGTRSEVFERIVKMLAEHGVVETTVHVCPECDLNFPTPKRWIAAVCPWCGKYWEF